MKYLIGIEGLKTINNVGDPDYNIFIIMCGAEIIEHHSIIKKNIINSYIVDLYVEWQERGIRVVTDPDMISNNLYKKANGNEYIEVDRTYIYTILCG